LRLNVKLCAHGGRGQADRLQIHAVEHCYERAKSDHGPLRTTDRAPLDQRSNLQNLLCHVLLLRRRVTGTVFSSGSLLLQISDDLFEKARCQARIQQIDRGAPPIWVPSCGAAIPSVARAATVTICRVRASSAVL
jgi:hypothetical protein